MLCKFDHHSFIVLLFSQHQCACICNNISVIVDEGRHVRCCLFSDQGVVDEFKN